MKRLIIEVEDEEIAFVKNWIINECLTLMNDGLIKQRVRIYNEST